jgi:hypothetical protein
MPAPARRTDEKLWQRIKAKVTRGTRGGDPGQWSARKAQLTVAEYKKAGGGYQGRKPAPIKAHEPPITRRQPSADRDRAARIRAFRSAMNMPPARLRRWLDTPESRAAGQKKDASESVGHASGRRILAIRAKRQADLTDDDLAHMDKVVGYVRRHLKQRPRGDVSATRWRHSLMNWGHDPLA